MHGINRYYTLAKRPNGMSSDENFSMEEEVVRELKGGEVLIRSEYISLDPTNRIWMSDMDQYMPPVEIGERMRALGMGTVIASKHDALKEGDLVSGVLGWQTHPICSGEELQKLELTDDINKSALMGPLGMTGQTAYIGLDLAKPKEGETLLVSAAAGAVGSIVCQIGKLKGMKVVGISGSDQKNEMLKNLMGVDETINYKTENVEERIKKACPNGIDVYFENVGGKLLDQVLPQMNLYGRIPLCGLISSYNATEPVPGPYQFAQILMKRLTIQGFIVFDFPEKVAEASTNLTKWYKEGKIKHMETIVDGFENLNQAMNMLFTGENIGKLMVKV